MNYIIGETNVRNLYNKEKHKKQYDHLNLRCFLNLHNYKYIGYTEGKIFQKKSIKLILQHYICVMCNETTCIERQF